MNRTAPQQGGPTGTPSRIIGLGLFVLTLASCSSSGLDQAQRMAESRMPRISGHTGPPVAPGTTTTARFAGPLLEIYEKTAAYQLARVLDSVPRPIGASGYQQAIARLDRDLRVAGYGSEEGFDIEIVETAMAEPAWEALSAAVNAVEYAPDGTLMRRVKMAGFSKPGDEARTMLPRRVESFEVDGTLAFSLDDVSEGVILVTDERVRSVEQEAVERGAAAIVSSFRFPYAIDPTGKERHYDAIFAGRVRRGSTLPTMYVSPRTGENMRIAHERGALFELRGNTRSAVVPLQTLVATIEGSSRPDEVVYVITHADGFGANDNAAGAAGIVELARSLKRMIASGRIPRPRRTVRFVFGAEAQTATVCLEHMEGTVVAAIVADMIGASYAKTGARCLLERGWDPGAVTPLTPDVHTPWGAGAVAGEDIVPNGLAVVLRQALIDVGERTLEKGNPAWPTREHPWEGGSDHDAFLTEGIAAALVWHFTDFAYSTSLDRIEHIDPEELRRTSVAIGAAACAIADANMDDLVRHLDSLIHERRIRMGALLAVKDEDEKAALEAQWDEWLDGARLWIRALCAEEPLPEPETMETFE